MLDRARHGGHPGPSVVGSTRPTVFGLSDAERRQVEHYLAARHGISIP
jgi:hypothetical protein